MLRFGLRFGWTSFYGGILPPPFSGKLLVYLDGSNTAPNLKTDLVETVSPPVMIAVEAPCLTLNGSTEEITFPIDHGAIQSFEGSCIPTYTPATLKITTTAGTLYNIIFTDGAVYPCCEGKGDAETNININSTEGHTAEITTASPTAVWDTTTQDTYFYAMISGWYESEPSDGIQYPSLPSPILQIFDDDIIADDTILSDDTIMGG